MLRSPLPTIVGSAVLFVGVAIGAAPDSGVDAFRAKLDKWVETRRILSEERAAWRADEESLRATRDLLRDQRKELRSQAGEAEDLTSEAEEARRELLLERAELQRASRTLEAEIRRLELEVLALEARFPEPLRARLEPLTSRIAGEGEEPAGALGQRLVQVLGVLSQAEQWNASAHLVGETRAVSGDQKVAIRTLYWGLGHAVYAAAQEGEAGLARPTRDGWVFTPDEGMAEEAGLLLDIYEGNVDAIEFIPFSVEIR